jgi:predicted HTH domain antitoxin
MELNISIPENVYLALKIPDEEKDKVLLKELAITLYQRGYLSFGKARELAKMSKWEFHEEMGKRKIERHYDQENLKEDLAYGRQS